MAPRPGLTRRGWAFLGAAFGLVAASRILGTEEPAILGVGALALCACSWWWVVHRQPTLDVSRSVVPARACVGDDARVELRVTGTDTSPSALVTLTDEFDGGRRAARFLVPPLRRGDVARAAYRIPTEARGRFEIGPLTLTVTEPFGLVRRRFVLVHRDVAVVWPRIVGLRGMAGDAGRRRSGGAVAVAHAPSPDEEEFLTLRPYASGDDLRHIHWRSSARVGELVVRQDEARWEPRVTVFVDTRTSAHTAASFERAMEACASLAELLERSGVRYEIVTSAGHRVPAVDPRAEPSRRLARRWALLDALAVARPEPRDRLRSTLAALDAAGPGRLIAVMGRASSADLEVLGRRSRRHGPAWVIATCDAPPARRGLRIADASGGVGRSLEDAWRTLSSGRRRGNRVRRPRRDDDVRLAVGTL